MKDLIEKRLASMVDRPWARQLWAMKPAFSSARHMASSPSLQFQLGMFNRWACARRKETDREEGNQRQHHGGKLINDQQKQAPDHFLNMMSKYLLR